MATERQIAANRINALKSKGPRTIEGQAVCRRNALKHGLTARSLVIEGENPRQFEKLCAELFDTYEPRGVLEKHLVEMLAGILWRLRRVPVLESAAFCWMQRCHQERALPSLRPPTPGAPEQLGPDQMNESTAPAETEKQSLGRAVFHFVRDGDVLDKLNRHETQLINQLARVSAELEHSCLRRSRDLTVAGAQ